MSIEIKKEGAGCHRSTPEVLTQETILSIAKGYWKAGLSILPIFTDGTKRPMVWWRQYIEQRPTFEEVERWWETPDGIAVICGLISGGLEVFDFDGDAVRIFPEWKDSAEEVFNKHLLPIVRTPSGGYHVYFLCSEISRSSKIACDPNAEKVTLIETRGEGAYVIAPGSPPETHKTGKLYHMVQGDLCNIPSITTQERECLWLAAAAFDMRKQKKKPSVRRSVNRFVNGKVTPWDDFNRHAGWADILEPHGWESADYIHWTRPLKGEGCSAKVYKGDDGIERLTVFTTSVLELENKPYTKTALYAFLNHDGNFSDASKALKNAGWGGNHA